MLQTESFGKKIIYNSPNLQSYEFLNSTGNNCYKKFRIGGIHNFVSVINHKKSFNEMHLDMNTLIYLFTIIATNILFYKEGFIHYMIY